MQYAVIRSGGKQYRVSAEDTVTVDKLSLDGKKSVIFDEVLLIVNEDRVSIGKPTVKGAKVEATLLEEKKGDKIRVIRFKAKSRYRKTIGFRSRQTVVKIDKIHFIGEKSPEKTKEPIKTVKKPEKTKLT